MRIIAATNRDPEEMVEQDKLREDLYYRLHVVPIWMPPLRERGDDVIEIAQALLIRFNATEGRHFVGLSDEVQAVFRRYAWPGNIRQLGNVLWNIMLLNDASHVTTDMLPAALMEPRHARGPAAEAAAPAADPLEGLTLAEAERLLIERAIEPRRRLDPQGGARARRLGLDDLPQEGGLGRAGPRLTRAGTWRAGRGRPPLTPC